MPSDDFDDVDEIEEDDIDWWSSRSNRWAEACVDKLYSRSKLPRRNGEEQVSWASVKFVKMSMEMRSNAEDFGRVDDDDEAASAPDARWSFPCFSDDDGDVRSLSKYEFMILSSTMVIISKSRSNSEANWPLTLNSRWTRLAGRTSILNSTYRSSKNGLFLLHPPWPRPRRLAETVTWVLGWFIMSYRTESQVGYLVVLNAPLPW